MKKLFALLFLIAFLCCPVISAQENTRGKVREELSYDKQDRLHGQCLAWNCDSILIGEANYKHGVKHGVWKIWYDNGQLAYEMHYKNGEKTGTWKHWNEKGELLNERKYS